MGNNTENKKIFSKESPSITIGRSSTSTLQIASHALSRIQLLLYYKNNEWYLSDGDGSKPSTNGTWLYLNNEQELENNMIIKVSETAFKVII